MAKKQPEEVKIMQAFRDLPTDKRTVVLNILLAEFGTRPQPKLRATRKKARNLLTDLVPDNAA